MTAFESEGPSITVLAGGGSGPLASAALADAPEGLIRLRSNQMYSIPLDVQAEIQLTGAAKRFADLVERVPMLQRFAAEQRIARVESFEDLGKLLVPHSALKSYPLSLLEKGRYDKLTAWLGSFTAHDLSKVDLSDCGTIDDWIISLDTQTDVRVLHSTGSSGKLSFLPRGEADCRLMVPGFERQFDVFGDERPLLGVPVEQAPIIYLNYRYGAYSQMRLLDYLESDMFGGDSSMISCLFPGRFSAEAVSLAGRLRNAESSGELGAMKLSPKVMQIRDAAIREQERSAEYLEAFLDGAAERFGGRTVSILGNIPMLYRVAKAGIERGYEGLFAADSFCAGGGGLKGIQIPEDWRETVSRFLGPMEPPNPGHGMTEQTGAVRICPQGHFHIPPWLIPFVLNAGTGEQAPRCGTQTGRYGIFDLNPSSSWGGFLTGDEVTLSYGDTEPCRCGRAGAYLHDTVRRYGEREGGDDKITCAGAPQAYDRALESLAGMEV